MLSKSQNPVSALTGLQAALSSGYRIEKIDSMNNMYYEIDMDGFRITYAIVVDNIVNAVVVFTKDGFEGEVIAWQVAYATKMELRRQGLASKLLRLSLDDFIGRNNYMSLIFCAHVAKNNEASNKIAKRNINIFSHKDYLDVESNVAMNVYELLVKPKRIGIDDVFPF